MRAHRNKRVNFWQVRVQTCAKINKFTRATIKSRMLDIFQKGSKPVTGTFKYLVFAVGFVFNLQLILPKPFIFILAPRNSSGCLKRPRLQVDFNLHFGKEKCKLLVPVSSKFV